MKRRTLWVWLLLVAIVVSTVFQFWYLPRRQAADALYALDKLSPFTSDPQILRKYENSAMGVVFNSTALFDNLPLGGAPKALWLHTKQGSIHVDFMQTAAKSAELNLTQRLTAKEYQELIGRAYFEQICETELDQCLIFDSAVAFAALADLQMMIYSFDDQDFAISRATLAKISGWDFPTLFQKTSWQDMLMQLQEPGWSEQVVQNQFLHVCYCYRYDQHQQETVIP